MDAGRELFENNPMSLICSIVCNHEMQCAGNCVLGKKGSPVHFSSIETYISDMYLDRMKVKTAEQKKPECGCHRSRTGRDDSSGDSCSKWISGNDF